MRRIAAGLIALLIPFLGPVAGAQEPQQLLKANLKILLLFTLYIGVLKISLKELQLFSMNLYPMRLLNQ